MKTAVWAILYHTAPTDKNPRHKCCHEGKVSWCGWQRDKASSTKTYQHKTALPQAIVEVVKPIFEALIRDELLHRCLEGATQNQNESLNSVIWSFLSKETFAGLSSVETACAMAVSLFNNGAHTVSSIMQKCGLNSGQYCNEGMEKEDSTQVYPSKKSQGKVHYKQGKRGEIKEQPRKKFILKMREKHMVMGFALDIFGCKSLFAFCQNWFLSIHKCFLATTTCC